MSKIGYSFGFVMVVLGRQQLFTENTLTPIIPLLERRDSGTSADVTFGLALLRGIFAGWLIAFMVWLLPLAESGRLPVIVGITWLVSLSGFTHIIAGSIEVLYLVSRGALPWYQYVGGYMLPTLIGNILGGVPLVAALNHAQVVSK